MSNTTAAIPTTPALQACLQEALSPDMLEVIDESADHAGHAGSNGLGYGTHFRVRIGGAAFAGKSRVAQHRLVYDALQKFTDAGMHALAIEVQRP
jgi:BolA protein